MLVSLPDRRERMGLVPGGRTFFASFPNRLIFRTTEDGSMTSPYAVRATRAIAVALLTVAAAATAAFGQVIQEFPVIPGNPGPEGIVLGPDGNYWICEENVSKIG